MKRLTYGLFILTMFLFFGACKNATTQQGKQPTEDLKIEVQEVQKAMITIISPSELEVAMDIGDIQLIDVRTDKEWDTGHLKNAKHFQINNANWETQIGSLDKNKPVYVYCAKGGRSARSAKQLEEAGFIEIYDLKGGITDWQAAGKTVE